MPTKEYVTLILFWTFVVCKQYSDGSASQVDEGFLHVTLYMHNQSCASAMI
jgi:hypothetical protein